MKETKILLTGANGVLGREFARVLSRQFKLILTDLSFKGFKQNFEGDSSNIIDLIEADLAEGDQRDYLADRICNEHGVTCLINNAAYVGTSNLEGWAVDFPQVNYEIFSDVFELNVTAPFHLVQRLACRTNSELDCVINISSIYASRGPDRLLYDGTIVKSPPAYCVSKAALENLTVWLACMLSPAIRVNAVAFGGVLRSQPKQFVDAYSNKALLGRMAFPSDLSGIVEFLVSEKAGYITGEIFEVSGGFLKC